MKKALTLLALLLACSLSAQPAAPPPVEVAVLETSLGTMVFQLFEKDAPRTVASFKALVREGFYDGKPFYRVVAGHVIQTGDGGENDRPKVPDEFNSNPHVAGALGLAHAAEPNSGSTEIYVCLAPRPHLDGRFTVFGQVIEGMDVLAKIGAVPVNEKFLEGGVAFHEPREPVLIRKARLETRPGSEMQLPAGARSGPHPRPLSRPPARTPGRGGRVTSHLVPILLRFSSLPGRAEAPSPAELPLERSQPESCSPLPGVGVCGRERGWG